MIPLRTQKREAVRIALADAELQLRQILQLRGLTQKIPPYMVQRPYSTMSLLIAVARVRALRLLKETT